MPTYVTSDENLMFWSAVHEIYGHTIKLSDWNDHCIIFRDDLCLFPLDLCSNNVNNLCFLKGQ